MQFMLISIYLQLLLCAMRLLPGSRESTCRDREKRQRETNTQRSTREKITPLTAPHLACVISFFFFLFCLNQLISVAVVFHCYEIMRRAFYLHPPSPPLTLACHLPSLISSFAPSLPPSFHPSQLATFSSQLVGNS